MTGKSTGVILLVEDEPSIAEMLQIVLEEEGYKVRWAENGQAGLRLLAQLPEPPQLILSDVMMPGMDGREMIKQIQSNPAYEAIPIVIMSATTGVSSLNTVNYITFIPKPFDLDELTILIKRILLEEKPSSLQPEGI